MRANRIRFGALFLTLMALFAISQAVHATVKAENVVYIWDNIDQKFVNSIASVTYDGQPMPILHEVSFDNVVYSVVMTDTIDNGYGPMTGSGTCSQGNASKWAGRMTLGIPHKDNNPGGVINGFDRTDSWSLVKCDLDGDGDFDNKDRQQCGPGKNGLPTSDGTCVWPPTPYTEGNFNLVTVGVEVPCALGNCESRKRTTMFISLSDSCNSVQNSLPAGGVCFFAEAIPPATPPSPPWDGNAQVRILAGGGDKTVNVKFPGPTALTLINFSAESELSWPVVGVSFLVLLSSSLLILSALGRKKEKR